MPRIRFLHGFQGKETDNIWYEAGQEWDCASEEIAIDLVKHGRAELVMVIQKIEEEQAEKPRKRRKG